MINEDLELNNLVEGRFYKVTELSAILKNLGLPYSIFKIRELEKEGRIASPRTNVRIVKATGYGHRRYTKSQILEIVKLLTPKG